jgi:membrane protein DedA with SNARE-associated domain
MFTFFTLMFGTFVSEDLACITAGLLIRRGVIGSTAAIAACTLGIFVGDLGLWGLGRLFGRAVLAWSWVAGSLPSDRLRQLRAWLNRHAGQAIVASRFLPGTRLPLYVLAGIIGLPGRVFSSWALVGTLLWTPALVLLTVRLGEAFAARVSSVAGSGWTTDVVLAAAMLLLSCARRLTGSHSTIFAGAHRA